jgi:hypothetical protein
LLQQDGGDLFSYPQRFGFVGDPVGGRRVDRINGRLGHARLSVTVFIEGHCSFCA